MLNVAGELSGDSWGIFTFLCAALCNLPALPALNCTEELGAGQSIQKTYDLTRYLEHQLRTLAGTYLNYLGPPFNEPDFNPPRLARAERVPSATVDLDLWRGLTDNARLAANYRAYSRLLCYLRALDGQAGTAELRHRLGHFCSSLQGLVLSIAGVMSSLGYPLPAGPAGPPAPPGTPIAPNDFLKKMDDFWLLKELQTWLWRSAKDFNRLKKKVATSLGRGHSLDRDNWWRPWDLLVSLLAPQKQGAAGVTACPSLQVPTPHPPRSHVPQDCCGVRAGGAGDRWGWGQGWGPHLGVLSP
uniref:Cardiotrophin-like cytokine factor 1 n=1 Tax=Falco tinnunculus TaxID=100819 RepID=A0A8C4V6C2_FALTI